MGIWKYPRRGHRKIDNLPLWKGGGGKSKTNLSVGQLNIHPQVIKYLRMVFSHSTYYEKGDKKMWHIKYGQFESERDSEKWNDIHHFSVLLEREGFHIHANFTNYPYSCHFSDVGIHRHCEEKNGNNCTYSPTGFCSVYDQVRWTSIDTHISDKVAVEILIERLSESLEKNSKRLGHEEEILIREELQFFQIWEDNNE